MSSLSGETSLTKLLQSLTVSVHPSTFEFFTLPADFTTHIRLNAANPRISMIFFEPGEQRYTAIIDTAQPSLEDADGIDSSFPGVDVSPIKWKMLTLNVHSSLEAVGFMAVISKALADADIPCNCVAAYFHDHIFLPAEKVGEARKVIEDIASAAQE